MTKNNDNYPNDAHEFSDLFTDEDAISDIENDSEREFSEIEGAFFRGRDYPEYVIEKLYIQDHFDLDDQPR